jgi:hypothetical protein
MALIGDHPGGLMDFYIHRAGVRALMALGAGVFIAVDFKNTDKAESAQKRTIGAQISAPEVANEYG